MSSQNSGKNSTHHSPKVASGATTQDPRAATQQVPPIADPVLQQAQAIQSAQRKPRPKKKDVEAQSDDANQVQALSDAGDSLPMGSDAASSWSLSADLVGESVSESASESVGDEWSGVPNRGDGDLLLAQASVSNNPTGAGMSSGAPSTGASMATAVFNPSFLVAGVAVASIAAGGGAAANHVVSAKIVLGQVLPGNDLKVHVFKVNNNTKPDTSNLDKADWTFVDGSKFVAADGSLRLDLQGYQGLVKIVVRDGGDDADYNDDLTGLQVDAPDGVDLAVAYANVGASASPINVNHVTTWIAKKLEVGDGPVDAKTLLAANDAVAKILQLEGKDLSTLSISPPEAGPVVNGDASKYGVFNAILYAAGDLLDTGNDGDDIFKAIGRQIDELVALMANNPSGSDDIIVELGLAADRIYNSDWGATNEQVRVMLIEFGFENLQDTTPPKFTSPATATAIAENSGSNQPIYTAKATDAHPVIYSLKSGVGAGDGALFTIDSSTGVVTLTANPNFEAKNSYSFTVVATAMGLHTEQVVTLAITNVDEHITLAPGVTGNGARTFVVGQSGITLNVATDFVDPDAGASITYSISSGTLPAGLTLNTSTGVISGTPTGTGSAQITIQSSDGVSNGSDAFRVYDLSVVDKPVVNGLSVSDSTTPNNLGKAGESVSITVTVSEPVSVSAAATFTFQVGSSASDTFTATLSPIMSASATNSFVLTGTLPAAGDGAIRLVGISGGTLLGATSNQSADYAQLQAVSASNYTVDNAGPNIAISGSSAPVFSLQASGSAVMRDIKAGEKAVLTIPLGEDAANLIGLPSGTVSTLVSVNSVNKLATWSTSGSQLLLTYTVEAGDNGTLSVDNTALKAALSGVTDRVGNALTFGGSSTGVFSVANAPFSVDTSEPASINLTGMLFTSTVGQHSQTAAGTLSAGVGSISLNASGTDEAFIFTLASALPAGVGVQWSTNNGTTWSDATTVSSTMIRIPANIVAGDTDFNPTLRFVDNALNASATSTLDITITNDTTAPTLVSGVVNGSTLTLTFSEPIKTASGLVPTAADFTIVGNTINSISVSGSTIVLGLANPYLNGAAVGNLSYTNGNDVTDVQDAAGNELASFTGQSITNNTPPVPVLASIQPLSGLTNLDVTSKLVIPFSMPIALGSGKIYIKDGMGSAGWTVTNNDVANSTWTDTNDNDVEITLTNGAVTDLRIGGVSYSDLGMGSGPTRSTSVDVALTSGQIANYVTTSGNNLIIDIAPINNVRAAAAPWYGRGWTFDFDFGSSYHIEYEEGIVSSNGLATPALSDNTRLAFTTVTPLNTPAGATSQKFNDDGSLTAGYIWHNGSQGSGTQQSAAISLDFATGDHALVFQGNRYGLSSGNPVPPPANALLQTPVGGNVNVRNFLSGDVIYADNGGNMTLQTLEGRNGSSWSGTGVTTKMTYDASVNGSAQYIWFGSYSGSNITQLGGGNTQFESSTAMNSNAVIFG